MNKKFNKNIFLVIIFLLMLVVVTFFAMYMGDLKKENERLKYYNKMSQIEWIMMRCLFDKCSCKYPEDFYKIVKNEYLIVDSFNELPDDIKKLIYKIFPRGGDFCNNEEEFNKKDCFRGFIFSGISKKIIFLYYYRNGGRTGPGANILFIEKNGDDYKIIFPETLHDSEERIIKENIELKKKIKRIKDAVPSPKKQLNHG